MGGSESADAWANQRSFRHDASLERACIATPDREAILDAMPPFLGGGDMISTVTLDAFTPNELPWKFEAGTPAIAEAIGLGAAVDYLAAIGMDTIHHREQDPDRRLLLYVARRI